MSAGFPEGINASRELTPIPVTVGAQNLRVERLRPLVHEIANRDLVYRTESGAYLLHDDVQALLGELTSWNNSPVAQIFIGRPCQHCGAQGLTRLAGGLRTCEACREVSGASVPPVLPTPVGRRWHRSHPLGHKRAG
jgi:hypothetical protein